MCCSFCGAVSLIGHVFQSDEGRPNGHCGCRVVFDCGWQSWSFVEVCYTKPGTFLNCFENLFQTAKGLGSGSLWIFIAHLHTFAMYHVDSCSPTKQSSHGSVPNQFPDISSSQTDSCSRDDWSRCCIVCVALYGHMTVLCDWFSHAFQYLFDQVHLSCFVAA